MRTNLNASPAEASLVLTDRHNSRALFATNKFRWKVELILGETNVTINITTENLKTATFNAGPQDRKNAVIHNLKCQRGKEGNREEKKKRQLHLPIPEFTFQAPQTLVQAQNPSSKFGHPPSRDVKPSEKDRKKM